MSDDVVIRAEGLGKRYTIGHAAERERYVALRDVLARGARNAWRKTVDMGRGRAIVTGDTVEEFWALRDVSFNVNRGEVLGIVGRNGAGKSTLLKILSRITEPSEGQVTVKGRVASLLEVGTGFHPELTGSENIYLNGAILGMTRSEIRRKFDEIVAFAEIEKFLDTPVKRYSSGMYVRLAFAVAAHLEPEILVVDEVLAVGDAEFQKKCLGKMDDISHRDGRTVLFVSHNTRAVSLLCARALLLGRGQLVVDGPATNVLETYLETTSNGIRDTHWSNNEGLGDDIARLKSMSIYSKRGKTFLSKNAIFVELVVHVFKARSELCIGFDLIADDGTVLLRAYDTDTADQAAQTREPGIYRLCCKIPRGLLHGRRYSVAPRISIHWQKWIVHCDSLISADVVLDHGETRYWDFLESQNRPGLIAPVLEWKSETLTTQLAATERES
jgi:homopolymeric O-antigen transport system ATP-binding protein